MDVFRRQQLMFDQEEQDVIRNMVVLIAGAGGLGTHQALELQRIGVKKIYLLDYDQVEISNLNRQVFYGRDDIGESKVDRARKFMENFGLETEVVAIREKITGDTEIPRDVDIIFDALDNFKGRFQLEELALNNNIPMIHGGINAWYGQITTIIPGQTLTLKQLLGELPENKGEIPVLSPAVSVIASLQVIEAIRVILKRDDILRNKLLIIDLSDYSLEIIEI